MTKADKTKAARMTIEEVDAALGIVALAPASRDEIKAQMEQELTLVRTRYETVIAEQDAEIEEGTEKLQAWSDSHPDRFVEARSLALLHGVIGYRTGQPTLKTLRGVTWERVIALCKQQALSHYVVVKETVDKDGIIGDREIIGDDGLRTLGLRIDQAERFFVRPNEEAPAR